MTYKVFWQNLHKTMVGGAYHWRTVYSTDMGVETFTNEQDMLEFADKLADQGIYCYLLDYKAEKGIGDLAKHINQCYGCSETSYYRDLELVKEMLGYCKKHQFPVVMPFIKEHQQ